MTTYSIARAKESAVTIMELIAALAIVAILIVGALSLYNLAASNAQSSQLLRNIISLQSTVREAWQGKGGYGTSPINPVVTQLGSVPSDWSINGSAITNQYGGTVTITGNTATFRIELTDVPTAACGKLLTSLNRSWASVAVGSATPITAFPIQMATAADAAQCGQGDRLSITLESR